METQSTVSESSTTTTKVPYESEIPFYTDNWPYDHFSLVELLKVEAHVTFAKTIEKTKIGYRIFGKRRNRKRRRSGANRHSNRRRTLLTYRT
jgi:galactose-1-phosphate uridylyltransferase